MSFRFIFLSSDFYQEHSDCPEIEKKVIVHMYVY